MSTTEVRCTGCGEKKPRAEFTPCKKSPNGLLPKCRVCNERWRVANVGPGGSLPRRSTNERLRALGLRTEDAGNYQKHVYDQGGRLLFTGTALECSRWLDGMEGNEP